MTVIFTGDRVSAWGTWQGPGPDGPANNGTSADVALRRSDDFTVLPPDPRWDRSIRMRRFQGDYSQWIVTDPANNLSRAQLQGPGIYPMGVWRWTEWWVAFNSIALRESDDFHMYVESHTPSANPGGIWTGNLSGTSGMGQEMFRQWIGPGAFTHGYRSKVNVVAGAFNHYRVGHLNATGATGAVRFYRNQTLVWSQDGIATTTQSGTHYPEIGFYTYFSVTGTDDMHIAGFRVHDVDPGYPGATGPVNTTGLQVAIANGHNVAGGTSVHFANDPDRVTPAALAQELAEIRALRAIADATFERVERENHAARKAGLLNPVEWRRTPGRLFVPCELPREPRRLVRV